MIDPLPPPEHPASPQDVTGLPVGAGVSNGTQQTALGPVGAAHVVRSGIASPLEAVRGQEACHV